MQQFDILLKNEKLKQYEKIALFILIINLALFNYIAFSSGIRSTRIAALIGSGLILVSLGLDHFLVSIKNNTGQPYKMFAQYTITMTWLQMGAWWPAILCFVLGTLYVVAKRPLLVHILEEKIIYPAYPKKNIDWTELNTILLKDGLLTIDFKNNRFIQHAIDEKANTVNEQEFNEFCRQQMIAIGNRQ
ncbi:MAG: hypothetical protein ABIT05_15735 [Chitinophagaceae bacterium]